MTITSKKVNINSGMSSAILSPFENNALCENTSEKNMKNKKILSITEPRYTNPICSLKEGEKKTTSSKLAHRTNVYAA